MSDFRTTRLWRSTLEPRKNDIHQAPRERLRSVLDKFRERATVLAGEIPQDARELTVHDITHIDALWETADLILGAEFQLTPAEAFVLGGAFLIHDLGMGLAAYPRGLAELRERSEWNDLLVGELRRALGREPTPEELAAPPEDVSQRVKFWLLRRLHAAQAERVALIAWKDPRTDDTYHLIEDPELRRALGPIIGKIAQSHWSATADLPQQFPRNRTGTPVSLPNDWTIDTLKLALILRVADAAHLDARRAPEFLKVIRQPQQTSELHWLFQSKLYQVQRDGDRLLFTGQSFTRAEAQGWWLCYETLRSVDDELRRADNLNADLRRERFAVRGVRGIEHPDRLVELIPAEGWLPIDAQVRVGHVASLVSKLGGSQMYGDDATVPLRELIQNATDAVRARRILEARGDDWGTVCLNVGNDEHGAFC